MTQTQRRIADTLAEVGAMHNGHFRLTSGKHSDRYMQCAKLFEHPKKSAEFCALLAGQFGKEKIELVAGPAIGGIIMAYEVARVLGVRNIFAERENGVMALRRGFGVAPGTRALIVEDVVTTGGSVKEVLSLLQRQGAEVVGVGSVVDRSGGEVDFGVPFRSLLTVKIYAWEEDACPLCREGIAITKPGSRSV